MTDSDGKRDRAQALVAALWQRDPPTAQRVSDARMDACARQLQRVLTDLAAAAGSLSESEGLSDRHSARLLSETATAIHGALDRFTLIPLQVPQRNAAVADQSATWRERVRLARLERWLAARAENDPDAQPAADLCLWITEHLESAAPLPPYLVTP